MSINRRHLMVGFSGLAAGITAAPAGAAPETEMARLARRITVSADPDEAYRLESALLSAAPQSPADLAIMAGVVARWDRPDRPFMWAARQLLAGIAAG